MIDFCREAILSSFEDRRPVADASLSDLKIRSETALFVSLYKGRDQRGCMGGFFNDRSFLPVLAALARKAAFEDDRYPRLRQEELGKIQIGIWWGNNIETNLRVDRNGRGIRVKGKPPLDESIGVYLPYCAEENRWDEDELLQNALIKAGLSPWEKDYSISYFDAFYLGQDPRWKKWNSTNLDLVQHLEKI